MSESDPTFTIGLKQLAPDARKAGLEYPESELANVTAKELRNLLRAAEALSPKVSYPLTPEMRITCDTGRYVVKLADGRLHFVSWSSAKSRGGNPTADQIFAIVVGEEVEDDTTPAPAAEPVLAGTSSSSRRWVLGSLLTLAIIGVNSYSFWSFKKPPGNLLPPYTLKQPEPSTRLLESAAGNYETGNSPGDRRLQVSRSGVVVWTKYGPGGTQVERREFTVIGAESAGKDALFTSRKSLIIVKDPTTLVLFGDVYLRTAK